MFKKVTKIALAGIIGIGTMVGSSSLASAEPVPLSDSTSKAKVIFSENTQPTKPVNPAKPNPKEPVDPEAEDEEKGTPGPLSIDYVSNFDFGSVAKSGNAGTYNANPVNITLFGEEDTTSVAPYVQVTDNRGNHEGWTLLVEQKKQLSNETADEADEAKELKGAQIKIGQGTVTGSADPTGIDALEADLELEVDGSGAIQVFKASEGAKGGTFVNSFGTAAVVEVELSILAGTKVVDGDYTTDLFWTLDDTPLN